MGELTALPQIPSWIWGGLLLREGRGGKRGGKEKEGRGWKRRGRRREGRWGLFSGNVSEEAFCLKSAPDVRRPWRLRQPGEALSDELSSEFRLEISPRDLNLYHNRFNLYLSYQCVARWPSGWDAGLAINRSRVRILASPLSSATPGRLLRLTHMCLCHQAV